MFFRQSDITLNRVHDTICVREGDERLTLKVDGDAMRMTAGLNAAAERIKGSNTDEEMREATLFFAGVIFGDEQAQKLMAFYLDDSTCVINICARYFSRRLAKKIEKAQKKK